MGIITQGNEEKDSGGVAELSPRPAHGTWMPIETAPKSEEWCVVGKIGNGKLLWWYRAMFWRGGWHTARGYDTRVEPNCWLPLPEPICWG